MLQGYVVLYTDFKGFEMFLMKGCCKAKIKKDSNFEFSIVVPSQVVQTEPDDPKFGNHMGYTVAVDLKKVYQ